MRYCLNCGEDCGKLLCDNCAKTADIEKLCLDVSCYKPGFGDNIIWTQEAAELQNKYNFRNVSFALADHLPSPRKEYIRLCCLLGGIYLGKRSYDWLFEIAPGLLSSNKLSLDEKENVRGILLDAYSSSNKYKEAEETANSIGSNPPDSTIIHLSEYLIKTRRYDKAEEILNNALPACKSDMIKSEIKKLLENIAWRRKGHDYLPASNEDKQTYVTFVNSIGISAQMPVFKKDSIPDKIDKADYPEFIVERNAGFRNFVSYDLETTGLSCDKDAIIEIGAVKVADGEITERFQMFVKPYKKSISEEITNLTGITKEMVKEAPEMWDAFNSFVDFIGENIVIGYNNTVFDNRFLMRAGRYARRTLSNRFFDVKTYAKNNAAKLGCEGFSLGELSQYLNIANPEAHRALADAETTARVYLALLDRFGNKTDSSTLDEQLDGDWV